MRYRSTWQVLTHLVLVTIVAFLASAVSIGLAGLDTRLLAPVNAAPVVQSTPVQGLFAGTVIISQPIALGSLDLAFDLTPSGDELTAVIDLSQTQAFAGTPPLIGSITGVTESGGSTFRLAAENFAVRLAGQDVTRSIVLTGEISSDGTQLSGTYTERIQGYAARPIEVTGDFVLARSFRSRASSNPVAPAPSGEDAIYLPFVSR